MPDNIGITLPDFGRMPWPDIGPIVVGRIPLALVLLGVFALIMLFLVLVSRGRKRRCPFCRKKVAGAAALCKYCGSSLLRGRRGKRLAERLRASRR